MTFSSNACRSVVLFLSLSLGGVFASTPPVNLLSAGNYVILTKAGISTVPDSVITGDIGVSPIAATAMTGFSLAADSSGDFSTSTQITGRAFAANYNAPITSALTTAVSAMEAAYTDAAGRVNPDAARKNLNGGILGFGGEFGGVNAKLTPGVYTFGSDVTINSTIYFDGTAEDVFIIQTAGNLLQAKDTQVLLSNGALASNIFWQIAGHVQVRPIAHMEGILLVKTQVLFETGSSLSGRILAQTAADLQSATITESAL